jgi:hypothetical protein
LLRRVNRRTQLRVDAIEQESLLLLVGHDTRDGESGRGQNQQTDEQTRSQRHELDLDGVRKV